MKETNRKTVGVFIFLFMVITACFVVVPGNTMAANQPPVADAEPDYQYCLPGEDAGFWGSNSYDPDGYIVSFEWDFGDGSNSSEPYPYHAYSSEGLYFVTLTVTDNGSATDTDIVTVNVTSNPPNEPPIAEAVPYEQLVGIGQNASFMAYWSRDTDGYIVSYEWDFGDGSNGSGYSVVHVYTTPGFYNVTLTVTDDDNATDSCTVTVEVLGYIPLPPVSVPKPDYQEVVVGEKAFFDGSDSYDPDGGNITEYTWYFGDGTSAKGMTAEHAYTAVGLYKVSLSVKDDEGQGASKGVKVNVTETAPPNKSPIADADPYTQTVVVGEDAWFSGNMSYDPDGSIVSYEWNFGDGSTGTGIHVTHAYAVPGTYSILLTVTDNEGATDTDSCIVYVLVPPDPLPPRNQDAELVKGALSDVRITWIASQDDGAGEDDIAGYTVYKSQTGINGVYEVAAWISALGIPDKGYEWVDSGAGDGNWNNYFYIIRAKDVWNKEEQNSVKVGKFASLLDEGWNMISVPHIQKDTSREVVLQTIDGNYVAVQGYHAGKSRPWLNWHRDKPNYLNDVFEINHLNGYYIDMLVSDYLVTAGRVADNENIVLKTGWNLVGYPCLTEKTVADALSSIAGKYNMVEKFDPVKDKEVGLLDTDLMAPGLGYWIHVTQDCVWTITN